jgi:hypothetical protein
LVIKVSSDPAENTSTSPLCFVLVELGFGVVEELLQPATASPMQAIDANAAICAPRR